MKKFLTWLIRLLPLAYMLAVWLMSSMPDDAIIELPDSAIDAMVKESLHLIEFAILFLLLVMAVLTTGRFTVKLSMVCAAISILYGLSDEIHQSFVPYRSATVIDFVKDTTGVLVCYYFVGRAYRNGRFQRVMSFFEN